MMTFLIIMGCIIGYLLIGILAVGAMVKIEDITIDEFCHDDDNIKMALGGVLLMPLTVIILLAVLFGKTFVLCLKHVYKISQDDAEKKVKEEKKIAKKEEKEKEKEKKKVTKANKITRFELVDFSE